MSAYDKYDPKDGGFRAKLDAALPARNGPVGEANAPLGVALTANGTVVAMGDGAAQSGFVGVVVTPRDYNAGDVVDIMTDGEIVNFDGVAGTDYFVDPTDGFISSSADRTAAGTGLYIGHTVEADRLVVRIGRA